MFFDTEYSVACKFIHRCACTGVPTNLVYEWRHLCVKERARAWPLMYYNQCRSHDSQRINLTPSLCDWASNYVTHTRVHETELPNLRALLWQAPFPDREKCAIKISWNLTLVWPKFTSLGQKLTLLQKSKVMITWIWVSSPLITSNFAFFVFRSSLVDKRYYLY
jgi:hypothetical protein